MGEDKEIAMKREALLSNPAFQRFVKNWELYQKLLKENPDNLEEIKQRMHELYPDRELPNDPVMRERMIKFKEILTSIFNGTETGIFSQEKLVSAILQSGLIDTFLSIWNPKPGESADIGNHRMVNNMVAYALEKDGSMSLHVKAAPVAGTAEIMMAVVDGFGKVAEKLLEKEFEDVKQITMESWLLAKGFDDKIKAILGDNIVLEDVPDDLEVQILALQYNGRSLGEYLKNGKLPPIRRLTMTKEQFLERFGSVNPL